MKEPEHEYRGQTCCGRFLCLDCQVLPKWDTDELQMKAGIAADQIKENPKKGSPDSD